MQIVKIYLSSATFDEIEKEMKVGTTLNLTLTKLTAFRLCNIKSDQQNQNPQNHLLPSVKVTTEAALGLIGGTFGLFTGNIIFVSITIIIAIFKCYKGIGLMYTGGSYWGYE